MGDNSYDRQIAMQGPSPSAGDALNNAPASAASLQRMLTAAQARIAELEATLARVNGLCRALFVEADDMMADVSKHAKASALIEVRMRIESALAPPGK